MPKSPRISLLLLLALAACKPTANVDAEPKVHVEDGYIASDELARLAGQWTPELKEALRLNVYADRFNRFVKPCGDEPGGDTTVLAIPGDGFGLARRHRDDLTCALAETGTVLISTRDVGGGLEKLIAVRNEQDLLVLEVRRDASGAIAEVVSVHAPDVGLLILRPRPADAEHYSQFARRQERIVSTDRSLDAIRALLGQGEFDLSAVGIGPAPGETSPADESGCAETGNCAVAACAPARRDNSILRRELFSERDKNELICPTLARWQTERHLATPPDEALIKHALILAVQAIAPEADLSDGLNRVVTEHSRAGTRTIAFSPLAPGLLTTPIIFQTVRDVADVACEGNKRRQRCRAKAQAERFSRVVNLPPGTPQGALLETIGFPSLTYTKDLDLTFERRNARWELEDPEAVGNALLDPAGARIDKGMAGHLLDKLKALPR